MIKKLTEKKQKDNEIKRLKSELKEIYKHYLEAKKLIKISKQYNPTTGKYFFVKECEDCFNALTSVYQELYVFEHSNKNSIGYTSQINTAIFSLYAKIDNKKVELIEYKNRLNQKQLN